MAKDISSQGLIWGLVRALKDEFGNDYQCYVDSVPQNFKTPAFFIRVVNSNYEQMLGRRRKLSYSIMVTYLAKNVKCAGQELNSIADRIYPTCEYILDDENKLIRANSLQLTMLETELHLTLKYTMIAELAKVELPKMGSLQFSILTKGQQNG